MASGYHTRQWISRWRDPLVLSILYSFTPFVFIAHLLWAMHHARLWTYNGVQDTSDHTKAEANSYSSITTKKFLIQITAHLINSKMLSFPYINISTIRVYASYSWCSYNHRQSGQSWQTLIACTYRNSVIIPSGMTREKGNPSTLQTTNYRRII